MKSYKRCTTQKKMNWAGHEFLAWIVVLVTLHCLKNTTWKSRTRAAIGNTDLKNCVLSFPKIDNRQLILAKYVKTGFRSKRGTSKAFSAVLT